jgi:hypothetical protein
MRLNVINRGNVLIVCDDSTIKKNDYAFGKMDKNSRTELIFSPELIRLLPAKNTKFLKRIVGYIPIEGRTMLDKVPLLPPVSSSQIPIAFECEMVKSGLISTTDKVRIFESEPKPLVIIGPELVGEYVYE